MSATAKPRPRDVIQAPGRGLAMAEVFDERPPPLPLSERARTMWWRLAAMTGEHSHWAARDGAICRRARPACRWRGSEVPGRKAC